MQPSVTAKGETIKAAIAAAMKALPRNSPNPSFNHVILNLDVLAGVYCYATNGQQTVVTGFAPVVTNESMPVTILLNDACLKCLMTARDDEDVTISVALKATKRQETFDEHTPDQRTVDYYLDSVAITLERSRFRFDVRSYDVLPPNTVEWNEYVEFQRDDFDQMVRLLGGVFDESSSDHNMSGVLIHNISDTEVEASATDGRRIGIGKFPALLHGNIVWHTPVIPRQLLKIARSIDSDSTVLVTFSERSCFIRIGDVTCEGALASGRFPNTSGSLSRMDTRGVHVGDVKRESLIYGLKCAQITTNRQLDVVGVVLESAKKGIRFRSEAPDRGKSCILTVDGLLADFRLMLDPSYLLPVLAALPDEVVKVHVLDDLALQVSTPTFRFLLMGIQT